MKDINELIDLGAISVETRGIEPLGPVDEDQGEH
ncbi:benenodin family lasso peptide [Sphingopyxis terrae subsp. ummariensis]